MLALGLDVRVNQSEFLVARCLSRAILSVRRTARCSRVVFCLRAILGTPEGTKSRPDHCEFPNVHGRTWADISGVIQGRSVLVELGRLHKDDQGQTPVVANMVMEGIDHDPAPCFQAVRSCERALHDAGLETPTWREMSDRSQNRTGPSLVGSTLPTGQSLATIAQLAQGWGECTAAQVCREAGGRVATNVMIRDLDLGEFNAFLWQGAQLAIDTTLVSLLRGDGSARPRAADHNGAALEAGAGRKPLTRNSPGHRR